MTDHFNGEQLIQALLARNGAISLVTSLNGDSCKSSVIRLKQPMMAGRPHADRRQYKTIDQLR